MASAPLTPAPITRRRPCKPGPNMPKRLGKEYGSDYFDRKMRQHTGEPNMPFRAWAHRVAALLERAQARLERDEIETLVAIGHALKGADLVVHIAQGAGK